MTDSVALAIVVFGGLVVILVVGLGALLEHAEQRVEWRVVYNDLPDGKNRTRRLRRYEARNLAAIWPGRVIHDPYPKEKQRDH